MAKAVDHDITSSVVTTGWETGKGAIVGGLVPAIAAGALTAGVIAAGGALTGVGVAAMFTGAAGTASMIAIGAFAAAAFAGLGTIGAIVGGVIGVLKGGSRIGREKHAYADKAAQRSGVLEAKVHQAQMMGYEAGVQDAQQAMVRQLQYASLQDKMHQDEVACGKCVSHVAKEMQRRDTQAATGKQIG